MELRNSRTLITGGAGLVGSHIADLLVEEGVAEIVIFDNFDRGRRENLTWAIENGPVTIVEGDIRDRDLLARSMEGIDVLFHQAAIRITQCAEEPRLALEALVDGSYNVIEAAVNENVGRLSQLLRHPFTGKPRGFQHEKTTIPTTTGRFMERPKFSTNHYCEVLMKCTVSIILLCGILIYTDPAWTRSAYIPRFSFAGWSASRREKRLSFSATEPRPWILFMSGHCKIKHSRGEGGGN